MTISRLIRQETQDGWEIVRIMLEVMRAKPGSFIFLSQKKHQRQITLRDIVDAAKWLAERGFGKIPQAVPLDEPPLRDYSSLTLDELRVLFSLVQKAKAGGRPLPIGAASEVSVEELEE